MVGQEMPKPLRNDNVSTPSRVNGIEPVEAVLKSSKQQNTLMKQGGPTPTLSSPPESIQDDSPQSILDQQRKNDKVAGVETTSTHAPNPIEQLEGSISGLEATLKWLDTISVDVQHASIVLKQLDHITIYTLAFVEQIQKAHNPNPSASGSPQEELSDSSADLVDTLLVVKETTARVQAISGELRRALAVLRRSDQLKASVEQLLEQSKIVQV